LVKEKSNVSAWLGVDANDNSNADAIISAMRDVMIASLRRVVIAVARFLRRPVSAVRRYIAQGQPASTASPSS
jgi:hypothetical protein